MNELDYLATGVEEDEETGTIGVLDLAKVRLGRRGENLTQTVTIDCSAWVEEHPELAGCSYYVAAVRPGETSMYLPAITAADNVVSWPITNTDTALAGWGRAEIRAVLNGAVKKSAVFRTLILPGIEDDAVVPVNPPDWATEIMNAVDDAEAAAAQAQAAAGQAEAAATTAVRYEPQTLTAAQQAQAQANLDVYGKAELGAALPLTWPANWQNKGVQKIDNVYVIQDDTTRGLSDALSLKAGDSWTAAGGLQIRLLFEQGGVIVANGGWGTTVAVTAGNVSNYDAVRVNARKGSAGTAQLTVEECAANVSHSGSHNTIQPVAARADVSALQTDMAAAQDDIDGLTEDLDAATDTLDQLGSDVQTVMELIPRRATVGVSAVTVTNGDQVYDLLLTDAFTVAAGDRWMSGAPYQFKARYFDSSDTQTGESGWMVDWTVTATQAQNDHVRLLIRDSAHMRSSLTPGQELLYTTAEAYSAQDEMNGRYDFARTKTMAEQSADLFGLNEPRAGGEDVMLSYPLSVWPMAESFARIRDRLYFGYTAGDGSSGVGAYDYATREIRKTVLKRSETDDHNVCAVHALADGTILAAFSGGHDTGNYMYTRRSSTPESIDRFDPPVVIPTTLQGSAPTCYAQIIEDDGTLYLFFRYNTSGGFYYSKSTDQGRSWTAPARAIGSNNQYYIKFQYTTTPGLLRLAMYANPDQYEGIRLGFLNLRTWTFYKQDGTTAITQAADGSVDKTGFGSPVIEPAEHKMLRLFDAAVTDPAVWRLLIADFDPPSGTYAGNATTYYLWNGTQRVQICGSDLKVWGKYPNGVSFIDAGRIACIRAQNGSDIVELYDTDGSTVQLDRELTREAQGTTTNSKGHSVPLVRHFRPVADTQGRALLWVRGYYNKENFYDFQMDLKIHRFDGAPGDAEARMARAETRTDAAMDALAADVGGCVAWCTDAAAGSLAQRLSVEIRPIQAGSGVPAVDNVRALSPRSAVIIRQCQGYALEQGSLAEATGNPMASSLRLRTAAFLPVSLLGETTVVDLAGTGRANDARARRLYFYDSAQAFLSAPSTITETLPFSFAGSRIPEGAAFFKVVFQIGTAGTENLPYDGQRLALDPSSLRVGFEGRSVYGGRLDLVSGVLTVTHTIVTPVAGNINKNSNSQYYVKASAAPLVKAGGSVWSNMFRPMGGADTTSTAGVCYINGTGGIRFNTAAEYSSVADMLAAHPGLAFVYELTTPMTYHLTPMEVALLAGEATVYTEDGGAELRYVRRIADAVAAIEHPDVTVSGTAPAITAQAGRCYLCGTLTSLSFTPCADGLCEVIFTSGSTPTVLTGLTGVKMPDWWTGTAANRVYDIMILNGTLGVVMSWAT